MQRSGDKAKGPSLDQGRLGDAAHSAAGRSERTRPIPIRCVTELDRVMARGRKPLGERALTPAERSARYRATHQDGAPRIRYRRPADRRSKAQRWRDAVTELVELQGEYQTWLESLPGIR